MRTPALEQLMGAYLHQDFDLVGDVWDNVDAFVLESPDLAPQLAAEIAWALETCPDDGQLEEFLQSLGAQVGPGPDEGGYRAWLQEISRRVAATATDK